MFDPSELEQLRELILEILESREAKKEHERKREVDRIRKQRWRDRHAMSRSGHALVTLSHASPQESVTVPSRSRHAPLGSNGSNGHLKPRAREECDELPLLLKIEETEEARNGRGGKGKEGGKGVIGGVGGREGTEGEKGEAGRGEASSAAKKSPRKPILMSNKVLTQMCEDPLYEGIDLVTEAFKFERWCRANDKPNTIKRFVNWINKVQ